MDDIRFHPEAQAALAWYEARSPQAVMRFEAEVERVLGLVAANPGMFPKYDDENRFTMLRRFPYSVVYQLLPGQVYVVALAHSRRSAGYWRGRD